MKNNNYVAVNKMTVEELVDTLTFLSHDTLKNTNSLVTKLATANKQHIAIKKINRIAIVASGLAFLCLGISLGLYFGTNIIKTQLLDDKIFISKQLKDEIRKYQVATKNMDKKYQHASILAKKLQKSDITLYRQDNDTFLSLPKHAVENNIYPSKNGKILYLKFIKKHKSKNDFSK